MKELSEEKLLELAKNFDINGWNEDDIDPCDDFGVPEDFLEQKSNDQKMNKSNRINERKDR